MGCPPCNILKTILEIDKEGTKTNGREDKKANDDAQSLRSERWEEKIICVKKAEEDSPVLEISWIHQYEDS